MSSRPGATLEERRRLAENLDDPVNRFYRYPVSRLLLQLLGGLPLRPDHVTYIHTAIGVAAGALVARSERYDLLIAFILLEVRMVLDCYDGVLARAKKLSSPRGRTIDELGDAVSYIALCIGMTVHLHRYEPRLPPLKLAAFQFALLAIGAMTAHSFDFYKRRLGSALKDGRDAIAEEIEQKEALVRSGKATFITRFGIFFDRWQVRLYEPRHANGSAVETVLARAHTPSMRFLLKMVGMLSWDNALSLLHIGLLFGAVLHAEAVAMAYGIIMFVATAITMHSVLGGQTDEDLERRSS